MLSPRQKQQQERKSSMVDRLITAMSLYKDLTFASFPLPPLRSFNPTDTPFLRTKLTSAPILTSSTRRLAPFWSLV
jgi:hypothetical protein